MISTHDFHEAGERGRREIKSGIWEWVEEQQKRSEMSRIRHASTPAHI